MPSPTLELQLSVLSIGMACLPWNEYWASWDTQRKDTSVNGSCSKIWSGHVPSSAFFTTLHCQQKWHSTWTAKRIISIELIARDSGLVAIASPGLRSQPLSTLSCKTRSAGNPGDKPVASSRAMIGRSDFDFASSCNRTFLLMPEAYIAAHRNFTLGRWRWTRPGVSCSTDFSSAHHPFSTRNSAHIHQPDLDDANAVDATFSMGLY